MRKLYYEDSHLTEFTARVTGCETCEKGCLVTLDATAFYPEGGGQACDVGTLGGVRVLDVRERDGDVVHLCEAPLTPGATVEGRVDRNRRFDLMQQHTGEHIVSGLLHEAFGYHNTGFHVGAEVMEVDFDGPIDPASLARIEEKANRAVWANLPLKCWYPAEEELPSIPYRTKRPLPWPVRIVEIPGIDRCACCGVHVKATGEVGLIKILSCVSLRGGVRLEMVCGARAYRYLAAVFDQNRQVSQAFSAKMLETGEAAKRMNETLAAQKLLCASLRRQVFSDIARRYEGRKDVLHFQPDLEPGGIRELAEAISGVCGGRAAVFSGGGYCLAAREGDLRELGKAMTAALRGRGGGKPRFQQGSVAAGADEIREFFAGLDSWED